MAKALPFQLIIVKTPSSGSVALDGAELEKNKGVYIRAQLNLRT